MSQIDHIKHLLTTCGPAQRREVFRLLRDEFPIHPLEAALHTKAEGQILYKQPLAMAPNNDWTDDFLTAVAWLRSGEKKTIRAGPEG